MKKSPDFGFRFALAATLILTAASAMAQALPMTRVVVYKHPPAKVEKPTGETAPLIQQLSHESAEKRQAAARILLGMGSGIEPQVRWALQQASRPPSEPFVPGPRTHFLDPKMFTPHHAFEQLQVLVSQLEELRLKQGSIISIHCQDEPLTNVLREMGRQVGVNVLAEGRFLSPMDWIKTNRVTMTLERVTFWDTLLALKSRAGLDLSDHGGRQMVFRKDSFQTNTPVRSKNAISTASGPFQISVIAGEVRRARDFALETESAEVKMTLLVSKEPKLLTHDERAMIRVEKCVDETGESLILGNHRTFASPGYPIRTVTIDLKAPRPGRKIKLLRGQVGIGICPDSRYLIITNLMRAQGQSLEFDGLQVSVARINADEEFPEILIETSAPTSSPRAIILSQLPASSELPDRGEIAFSGERISFYDEKLRFIRTSAYTGSTWDHLRGENTFIPADAKIEFVGLRQETERVVASWRLITSKRLPPAVLLWSAPSETRWLTAPFELHDLAFP